MAWYTKPMTAVGELPELTAITGNKPNAGFVGARDLVPGNLYYSGGCWRSSYVYLGRTSQKEFVWAHIGNAKALLHESGVSLLQRHKFFIFSVDATKSNKKVKPLADALNDPDAYVDNEYEMLITSGFKINMDGVTQQMLDFYSRC